MKKMSLMQMEDLQGGIGFGEDYEDCMDDVYSGHGWVSVWVSWQSAFIPGTYVAFSLRCMLA